MSYDLSFRARMNATGRTRRDRAFKNKSRSFDYWFENTLNKHEVVIDGIAQEAVIQDQNQNNNKDLSDDKYIVTKNESNIKVGSYLKWNDVMWLVFTDEFKTIATHRQSKIKEVNHYIKWMVDGHISGDGLGYPAFIQNQTLYTLGVSTSGNHSWIVNAKMMMYMQDNPETRELKIGRRIVIGGAVYQIMFKDYVSREGLIHYLLEQDMISNVRDNLELGVADYYVEGDNPIENPEVQPTDDKVLVITGNSIAKINSTQKYIGAVMKDNVELDEEIVEWVIADTEETAIVVESNTKELTIKIANNFKKVGSVITIIGKTSTGLTGIKTVNIASPY